MRLKVRRKTLALSLAFLSATSIIGATAAVGFNIFNKNEKIEQAPINDDYLDLDNDNSLDIISFTNLKKPEEVTKSVTEHGLVIPFNENNSLFQETVNLIDEETLKYDFLFFMQSLMNKKSFDLEMAISEPQVKYDKEKMIASVSFDIKYQNKTNFDKYYFIEPSSEARMFSIKNDYEIINYQFFGKVKPKLYDGALFGYEIVGDSFATDLQGQKTTIKIDQPSSTINTKIEGFTTQIGYVDIASQVDQEIAKMDSPQFTDAILSAQEAAHQEIMAYSLPAQNILKRLVYNQQIGDFLVDSSHDIVALVDLALKDQNFEYKQLILDILPSVLNNESIPKIIFDNAEAIKSIVSEITFLQPFLPIVNDILSGTEEEIAAFISEDVIGVLNSLGALEMLNQFPGLIELLPKLGSDEGILTVLIQDDAIPVLVDLINTLLGENEYTEIITTLLYSLTFEHDNILERNILDVLVDILKMEHTKITPKKGVTLVNNPSEIETLMNKVVAKDVDALQTFFDYASYVDYDGFVPVLLPSPDLESMTVNVREMMINNETVGLVSWIVIDFDNDLYFPNGSKVISSTALFAQEQYIPPTPQIDSFEKESMLMSLLKTMMPQIDDTLKGLLTNFTVDNPNLTVENLKNAIDAIANPWVDLVKGGYYYDWMDTFKVVQNADLEFDNQHLKLNGDVGTKYIFTQSLGIDLEPIYAIMPDDIDLGGSVIAFDEIVAWDILPRRLWFHENDWIEIIQEFDYARVVFDVQNVNGQNEIFWKAFSTTIYDLNMPKTLSSMYHQFNSISGSYLWTGVHLIYYDIMPNLFYSRHQTRSYYTSMKPLNHNIDVSNYSHDIYYDINIKQKISDEAVAAIKKEMKAQSEITYVPGTFIRYKATWLPPWMFDKKEVNYNFSFNSKIWDIFEVSNPYFEDFEIHLSYNYFELMKGGTLFLLFELPTVSFESMSVSAPFKIFENSETNIGMTNHWVF